MTTRLCFLAMAAGSRIALALIAVDPSPRWKSTLADSPGGCPRPKLGAVVFPQYHRDPTNDLLWGDGYTEWVALNNSNDPLLPRPVPPLNYYDMTDDNTVEIQAEMARSHGISAFFYYHYWFKDGRRALDAPVARILEKKTPRFPFALIWAVSSWTPRWHGPNQTNTRLDDSNFPRQEITAENLRIHLRYLETTVWSDDRYVQIDGRPLFMLHGGTLQSSMWSSAAVIMQVLRDSRMKPYVGLAIRSTRPTMPTGTGLRTFFMFAKEKLVDVVAHFDFGMLWEPRTTALPATIDTVIDAAVCDAKNVHRESMGSEVGKLASVEWEFSAFAGFDNIARHPSAPHIATRLMTSKSRTGKGRPEEFFRMLSTMAAIAGEGRPVGRKCSNFIAVNAWNEWGEGNVLEPSNVLGNRMLEATKRFASELNLMPDNALIESCDTHNYGTYDPEARMNNAWFLENYQLLKRQLYHWRTKPMITLSYPHLDDWKPSFLLDKKDLGAGTVFVIGMHQTGATMLQHALHMLGYNAYQLPMLGFDGAKRCFVNDTYREAREAILFNLQGRSRMLHCLKREGLFEQYNAYVDAPFYGIVNQLVRTFRRARFIYLSRDIDEWISSTQSQLLDRKAHEDVPVVDEHGDWKLGNMKNNIHGMMYGAAHTGPRTEKDIRIWKFGFVQQMAETMRIFAHGEIDQNLLVMDLKSGDGFDVLGPFLGRPDAAEWHMPSKSLRHQHRRNATASTIVKAESHHR